MNIYFIGQTTLSRDRSTTDRIYHLAAALTAQGHSVTAFTATQKTLRRSAAMSVRYVPSFNPEHPGGWLYTIASLFTALRKRADVLHIASWKAAALAPLAALIRPHATIVWTVDAPATTKLLRRKVVVWATARLCDAITTPTRALQYHFRNTFGVLPIYIPDGYEIPFPQPIPTSFWKLRKNMYVLAVCDTPEALLKLSKAYKKTKSRKNVYVLTNTITPALKRIQTRNRFIKLIESSTPRQRTSLIEQAASVIFTDITTSTEEFLLAMHSGKHMIAINHPTFQEIAGTTVDFFSPEDIEYYSEIMKDVLKPKSRKKVKSAIRAKQHFTWQRIFEDYEILYHYPLVRRVPVDSVRPNLQSPVPLG